MKQALEIGISFESPLIMVPLKVLCLYCKWFIGHLELLLHQTYDYSFFFHHNITAGHAMWLTVTKKCPWSFIAA